MTDKSDFEQEKCHLQKDRVDIIRSISVPE